MNYLTACDLCGSDKVVSVDSRNNVCRCPSCGYIFHSPRPTSAEISGFYSRDDKYDSWLRQEHGRDILWQRRLKKIEKHKKKGSLLDVGTGIGQFLFHARVHFNVQGTEVSDSAVKLASEKYQLNLRKGGLEELDFHNERFDVITLFHVLEHVESPSGVIDKCFHLLKEDGIIVIAVPNEIFSLRALIKRPVKRIFSILSLDRNKKFGVYGISRIRLDQTMDEIHLSYFTVQSLKQFLSRKNFSLLEDSLDPAYTTTGIRKWRDDVRFAFFLLLKILLGWNAYETIFIVAKRRRL
ncbi:MAG: methyltransferase domain-containing protein [Candidatus Omnitrophica bacterium]|nr:methyltransferase domain-containing protein [Candidatus Omnitrophota bacterium]